MRWSGRLKMGYFPLPLSEAQRIRKFLHFQGTRHLRSTPVLAMAWLSKLSPVALRCFATVSSWTPTGPSKPGNGFPIIVQGNTLEVQCPVECFGLLYLNPPLSKRFFSYV